MADLPDDTESSLQSGSWPVLVISNNLVNFCSPVVTIILLVSCTHKKPLSTHVVISERRCGLEKQSVVLAEQIMSINKKQLKKKIGSILATSYEKKSNLHTAEHLICLQGIFCLTYTCKKALASMNLSGFLW